MQYFSTQIKKTVIIVFILTGRQGLPSKLKCSIRKVFRDAFPIIKIQQFPRDTNIRRVKDKKK